MLPFEYVIFSCAGLMILIWLSNAIVLDFLLRLTRKEFPGLVGSEISVPYYMCPENVFFFLRKKAKRTLSENRKIRRLRKAFIALLICSVVFPVIFSIGLAVFVVFFTPVFA